MQENNNQTGQEKTKVGFPSADETKKNGNGKVLFLVVIILLVLAGAVWYLLNRKEETIEFTNDSAPPVVNREPTLLEEKAVNKQTLKLQVLNGTGTPGDAGKLEKTLNELGYSEIATGNADNYDYKIAEVTFSSDFSEEYRDEILEKLNSLYSEVSVGSKSLGEYDAVLITATAKGAKATTTPKPTTNATPTIRVTTTPTTSLSVTPTP